MGMSLRAVTLAVAGAVAVASPATTLGAPRPVTITYWAGHASGALYRAVVAEVAQFNRTHPAIHVIFHPIGASHHGLAAFEAGQAPNVGMVSAYVVPELAQAGAIVNLTPWIRGPEGLSTATIHRWYYPVVWRDMHTRSGTQYLLPLEKKALLVVYYNKALFARAGITDPPTTWTAVGADAAKITALGPRYHGIAWTPSLDQFFDIVLADGGRVFSTTSHRQAFSLTNPGAAEALQMLRRWVASGRMILTTGYQYQLDFGTGDVGMLIDASAGYTYDLASVGGKFPVGAAPDPAGTAGYGAQYINGASLVLFNVGTSAQKRAAWTFMKWLSSPSTNVYWDEHTNYLPLGPEAARLMASFYRTHPAMAASFTPPTHWWYKPRTGTWDAATTAMSAVFDEALRGQIGVTTALRQMSQVGTAYLSGKLRA